MILSEPIPAASARGSTFGPAFDVWLARCLAREGANRFPTVGQAVAALAEALGVRLEFPRRSSASLPPPRPSAADLSEAAPSLGLLANSDPPPAVPRRHVGIAIAAAVASLAVVAGVVGVVLGVGADKPQGARRGGERIFDRRDAERCCPDER